MTELLIRKFPHNNGVMSYDTWCDAIDCLSKAGILYIIQLNLDLNVLKKI